MVQYKIVSLQVKFDSKINNLAGHNTFWASALAPATNKAYNNLLTTLLTMDYATKSERVLYNKDMLMTVDHRPLIAEGTLPEKRTGHQIFGCCCEWVYHHGTVIRETASSDFLRETKSSIFWLLFLSSSKHAVMVINVIYVALNALGLAFFIWADRLINNSDAAVTIGDTEITDEQKTTFNMAYPYFFSLYCITLLVNFSTIFAAISGDFCLVVLGTVWYLLQVGFNIWLSLQMGFNVLLIISMLWFMLILYPHGVFVYEVNKGTKCCLKFGRSYKVTKESIFIYPVMFLFIIQGIIGEEADNGLRDVRI